MNVKVYTTPTCGYCHQVKDYLSSRGIQYVEHDVSRDRAAAQEMVNLTGQMGVPVIVVDGEVVIGFDRGRLETLLAGGGSNGNRPKLGLKIADAERAAGKPGAFIGGVADGGLGAKAGLRTGDVITEINARNITRAADVERALAGARDGNIVTIRFLRDGAPHKSEIIV